MCVCTVESRFIEPPRETKIGSRNRDFEISKVASNYAKLLKSSGIIVTFDDNVSGKAVNLGDGKGMQVPCTLHFKGTTKFINILGQQLQRNN